MFQNVIFHLVLESSKSEFSTQSYSLFLESAFSENSGLKFACSSNFGWFLGILILKKKVIQKKKLLQQKKKKKVEKKVKKNEKKKRKEKPEGITIILNVLMCCWKSDSYLAILCPLFSKFSLNFSVWLPCPNFWNPLSVWLTLQFCDNLESSHVVL